MRTDDPWYDAVASGCRDHDAPLAVAAGPPVPEQSPGAGTRGAAGASVAGAHGTGAHGTGNAAVHGEPGKPAGGGRGQPPGEGSGEAHAAVYLAVQRSEAFQQVRRRYRRFVLPVSAAFLLWYLAYVTAATAAPGLMARPVAGVFNVAMAAGLAQFASTFLLTWAYVRHARLRRDEAALELRWETQDMARTRPGVSAPRTCGEGMR